MRIIRQPAPRDWSAVTNQLIYALSAERAASSADAHKMT
jgi:hypothetical protein